MFLEKLLREKGVLVLMLSLAVFCGLVPSNGLAMPVDSQLTICNTTAQGIYLEKAQNFFNRKIVQNRLSKLGLNREEIQQYLSNLNQVQLEHLADKIDRLEAAGDSGLTILLIILLVAMCVLYFADYGIKLEPRRKK